MDSSGNRLDLGESKVKGLRYHVSLEWKNCSISASEKDKTVQQASLRKK